MRDIAAVIVIRMPYIHQSLFRPERFLSSNGKCEQDEQFIPFSVGKRRCPGESLAKIELFQFVTGPLERKFFYVSQKTL